MSIDVDIRATVAERGRRFELAMRFACEAPVVALYGPSGAGKSLTLQAMAGLLRPSAGHVRIGGRTLFDARRGIDVGAAQRGMGCVFQHYALFPHLSVRENIAFGLSSWRRGLHPLDAARVQDLLDAFGLAGLAQARPAGLSGGQQQRVALARALACSPQALLLDEPFAALDPPLRRSLRRELAQVRARWNLPMLLITHDVDDVLELADRAFVVEQGQVVREVDVGSGEARPRARRTLEPDAAEPCAHAQRVRALLWEADVLG
ncbi:MAG: ATP-binding cassette domain-containing protein [Aquabacterium sp.]|nr:MAG: ATP-binding cassette domain-containing protein [Aquabacterium sp.]